MMLLLTGDEDWFVVDDVLMMIVTVRVSFFHVAVCYWIGPVFLLSTLALWICFQLTERLRFQTRYRKVF